MFKKKKQSGFIALTSVLLFGALILIMGLSMASSSISEQAMTGYEKGGEKAVSAANSCVDIGVSRVKSGEASYDTTTTEVNLYDDVSCNLSFSQDPEHSYRVKVTGTASVDTSQRSFSHTEYAYVDNHEFIPDLVGYWPMDENRGYGVYNEALDDRGSYLDFNGVSNYVDCGNDEKNSALAVQEKATYELWFYSREDKQASLISQRCDYPTHGRGISIGNGQIRYWSRNAGTYWKEVIASYSLNEWYHVVLVQDGNVIKGYKNGVLVSSLDMGSNLGGHYYSYHKIANYTNSNYPFNGLIDEVRIYNRALSEAEIQKLYNETENITDGLVGHWEMDETFGDLAIDSSGNNNHGTIYGAKRGGSKGKYVGIEAFTTVGSHTWTVPEGVTEADVLVVGGGGGGGSNYGGGGGAGGLIFEEGYGVSGDISVEVGGGGIGSATTSTAATNGGNSSFGSLTAIGGGKGGNGAQTTTALGSGGDGGSGGGGGGHSDLYNILGGAGTTNQGNKGGNGDSGSTTTELSGGGGGGASQAGFNGVPQQGGAGGSGLYLGDVFGTNYGENGWFAGGGGGGAGEVGSGGLGGIGGGGDGGYDVAGGNASANTGGGGGAGGVELAGGDGGSGIVIIRYTKRVDGRHDKALEFDGVGNYVDAGNDASLNTVFGTETFTFSVWLKSTFKADYQGIINKRTSNHYSASPGGLFIDNDGNTFRFLIGTGNDAESMDSITATLDHGIWTHWTATAGGGIMRLYKNGVQIGSDVIITKNPPTNDQPLTIGSFHANVRTFSGLIDDVRIYNRALTEDEIRFLYQRGLDWHVNR